MEYPFRADIEPYSFDLAQNPKAFEDIEQAPQNCLVIEVIQVCDTVIVLEVSNGTWLIPLRLRAV